MLNGSFVSLLQVKRSVPSIAYRWLFSSSNTKQAHDTSKNPTITDKRDKPILSIPLKTQGRIDTFNYIGSIPLPLLVLLLKKESPCQFTDWSVLGAVCLPKHWLVSSHKQILKAVSFVVNR